MLRTHGLLTYARNTQLKIAGMLLSYVFVGLLIAAAISLTLAMGFAPGTLWTKLDSAFRLFVEEWDRILLGGALWTIIAAALFRRRVQQLLGASAIDRTTEPRLYNIVENLAISAGLPVPQISIVETSATNAFTTGFSSKRISLSFTRGALQFLNDRQLSAVVAHHLTLVLSGEVRKLSLASTLAGISIFAATWLLKPFYKLSFRTLLIVLALPVFPFAMAGAMITSALAAVAGAVLLKMSVSKLRIFVCDAGALELTKDAEALASAIQTMSMRGVIEGADIALQPLLFVGANAGWLGLHPGAEERVAAIRSFVPGLADAAMPLRLLAQQQEPSWRDNFAIPTWVTGSACSIPLGVFAAYCALTSNWSAVDKKAVQAMRDDVRVVMEGGMELLDPATADTLITQAKLYNLIYDLELDIDALNKARKYTAIPSAKEPQYAQIRSISPELDQLPYRKDQAHLIAAALKDRSNLSKAFYDSAYDCVIKHEDSEQARMLAKDWAGGFAAVAHSKTFQEFKRFPLPIEISGMLENDFGQRPSSEIFDSNTQGGQALIDRLAASGLGSSWTAESCVFQNARKSVENWVSVRDIEALGVRKEYIDAMNAGLALTPGDQELAKEKAENDKALQRMMDYEKTVAAKLSEPRMAQAIERLTLAPWNRGSPPLAPVFIPAFFLFLGWKILRGIKWLFSAGLHTAFDQLNDRF